MQEKLERMGEIETVVILKLVVEVAIAVKFLNIMKPQGKTQGKGWRISRNSISRSRSVVVYQAAVKDSLTAKIIKSGGEYEESQRVLC